MTLSSSHRLERFQLRRRAPSSTIDLTPPPGGATVPRWARELTGFRYHDGNRVASVIARSYTVLAFNKSNNRVYRNFNATVRSYLLRRTEEAAISTTKPIVTVVTVSYY